MFPLISLFTYSPQTISVTKLALFIRLYIHCDDEKKPCAGFHFELVVWEMIFTWKESELFLLHATKFGMLWGMNLVNISWKK
jgi:hypothetical protein